MWLSLMEKIPNSPAESVAWETTTKEIIPFKVKKGEIPSKKSSSTRTVLLTPTDTRPLSKNGLATAVGRVDVGE